MESRSKIGAVVTGVVVLASIGVVGAVFMTNASPYVTIVEAKQDQGESDLHLAGNILKSTVQSGATPGALTFTIKDQAGNTMNVDYQGEAIANIGEATQVVAIGGAKGNVFYAHKLLIKCPSKYSPTASGAKSA